MGYERTHPRATDSQGGDAPIRVLLVDADEQAYAHLRDLMSNIEGRQYELEWAVTYEEGLGGIIEGPYDAVLPAYRIGEKTGLDLVREAVSQLASRKPIIMLAGPDDPEFDEEALMLGASDYYPKEDLTPRSLDRIIRHAIMRKKQEKLLRDKASQDPLTGLANRRMVNQVLPLLVASARRRNLEIAVLYLDLDGFKEVNDTMGHATGDAVLKAIAGRWSQLLRPHDLLARIGGDEFVAIIVSNDLDNLALKVAQRFLDSLQDPIRINEHTLPLSVSVGVALYPDHGRTTIELLEKADAAMYQAKKAGKNRMRMYQRPAYLPATSN